MGTNQGTNSGTNRLNSKSFTDSQASPDGWPPATLVCLKSKGGKWYVLQGIPEVLRGATGGKSQVRRSTGTTDKREAERRFHSLTEAIRAEVLAKMPSPLQDAAQALSEAMGVQVGDASEDEVAEDLLQAAMPYLYPPYTGDAEEDLASEYFKNRISPLVETFQGERLQDGNITKKVSEVAEEAIASGHVTPSTVTYTRQAAREFEALFPDTGLEEVTQLQLYTYAESLHEEGRAANTISMRLTRLSKVFGYGIRKGYCQTNPRTGMDLSGLGKAQEGYVPFDKEELNELFKLDMPQRERLFMTVLLSTGMRRDEAALLKWEDIKEEGGIRYFDLRGRDVKTQGSRRVVPLTDYLSALLPSGEGRIFDYKLNKAGKTVDASQLCLAHIRKVTQDERKSLHSLRGTLKDLLRDAGVTKEVNDFITGHGSGDVAGKYGQGPSLKTRYEALNSVSHPWFTQ